MNFKDYFTSIKLVNAINLLLSTKHSITTVSELAGFNSHTNFANQFKNYLHFSPKTVPFTRFPRLRTTTNTFPTNNYHNSLS